MTTLIPKFDLKNGGSTPTGAINRPINQKLADIVSVKDFGAVGDGVTDDTAAITAALATSNYISFPNGTYAVTSITITNGKTIYFNNSQILALSNSNNPVIITGSYNVIYNLNINCNFNASIYGFQWISSSSYTCQFNKVYGLNISNAVYGIVYGAVPGGSAYNAPQSENTIYSYTTRAVQIPICCNQPNGALTLISPILDCDSFEWSSQSGYNATTYYTNAYCVINLQTLLTVIGGELLKAGSNLGYGIWGGGTFLNNTIEIPGLQALITNDLTISNNQNGYFNLNSGPAFKFDNSASGKNQGATLTLDNFVLNRPNGYEPSAGDYLISGTPTLPSSVVLNNTVVNNWTGAQVLDVLSTNISIVVSNARFVNYTTSGSLYQNQLLPNTKSIQSTTISSAISIGPLSEICTVSGTNAIQTITPPYFGFIGSITIIPTGVFTTITGGNIAIGSTAVVGKSLVMTYDGSLWHPSY